jgi:putative addiction module killer protein
LRKEPAKHWLDSIRDKSIRARVSVRIARAENGNFGDHKSIGEGVYEMRLHISTGLRIYYSLVEDKIILLLVSGDKSSQSKDIQDAKKYLKLYFHNK